MDEPLTVAHWIDGQAVHSRGADGTPVTNSATGAVIRRVPGGGAAPASQAVAAAHEAFPGWRDTSLSKRAAALFAWRELLQAARDELIDIIVTEHGKVADDAAGEVQRGIEVVEFACGIPHLLKGDFSENVSTNVDAYSLRQPLGVVAGITPFNFPVMVPLWMAPLAIACGNTFVLKPSEKDPTAPLRLVQLAADAGIPPGVLNVVQGGTEAVDTLLTHRDVAAVSFVGSTPVARHVQATATESGKRVQALAGAKNHALVLPDADVDTAADALVSAAFGSAGERCMAISAVVAVGGAADRLVPALVDRMKTLKVTDGGAPGAQMGPLITAEHRDRVASYLDFGVTEGAQLVYDGREHPLADGDGHWLGPSLFDHVTTEMTIYADEIFGPVLIVLRADDLDSAIALVNSNRWGNGAAVFTTDGRAARRFQRDVTAGMVGINVAIPVPMAYYSFGGWKDSLFGDLHVHGAEGVLFYTRAKAVTARWPEAAGGATFGFSL